MTDDRPAIARAVAKAFDLAPRTYDNEWVDGLRFSGSNVFDWDWAGRCIEWLLEHKVAVYFDDLAAEDQRWEHQAIPENDRDTIRINCPAAEFPARAVAALVQKGEEGE